ncbi:hypothetical protein C8A00DRAFT_19189, partial [Chaetomidium leptoderma]
RTSQFTLGRQTVSASGTYAGEIHDNVLRLHIHRTTFDGFLHGILSHLPLLVLKLITPLFPRWTLPRTFILKKQKPDWDDEFENEKRMYTRLSAIQGSTIPVCFGETSLDGRRALVLSDVGRVTLCDKPALQRDRDDMGKMIDDAFWALAKFRVGYGDIKLDNFHLVRGPDGDRIMIVDLESVEELDPRRRPERATIYSADHLFRYWRDAVESDHREREEELGRRHAVRPNAEEIRRLAELTRAHHLANPS